MAIVALADHDPVLPILPTLFERQKLLGPSVYVQSEVEDQPAAREGSAGRQELSSFVLSFRVLGFRV